jgi:hypothetical protein
MRYFHRTSLSPAAVLAVAERYFGEHLAPAGTAERSRVYHGTMGRVAIEVAAEGGHYTLITVTTDQMGESEIDKLAKRFLGTVHQQVEPGHVVRGAY